MRILCVDGRSQYALMNSFLAAIADGFERAGHQVVRTDVWTVIESGPPAGVDLAFSMGGIGIGSIGDVPLLTWLVDHPVWSPIVEQMVPDRDGVLVVDGGHLAALRDFLGRSISAGFVPHGIELAAGRPDFSDAERDIDVLVCGSYERRPRPANRDVTSNATLQMTFKLADDRWDHHVGELQVSDLYLEAARANLIPFATAAHRAASPYLAWLDGDIRGRRRLACVRALDRAGIRVHLVGAGWETIDDLEHAVTCGMVDHRELLELTRRAKVVCNVGPPMFNDGWHERIPLAMASGALAVTETNDWLTAEPLLPSLIDTYEMPDYEHLGDIVRTALDDRQRESRTRAAYEVVRDNHTWAHRARTILEMVEL